MPDFQRKPPLVGSKTSGVTSSPTPYLRSPDLAATRSKIDVERRFLLLDNRIVSTTRNVDLTIGSVEKHYANPLLVEDQPWERRFDNFYGNIIFDVDEEVYKCWYSPFIVANSAKGMSLQERLNQPYKGHKDQEMGICYAVSKDGIYWEKPNLGLVDYHGSKRNNIVWRGPHGAGVLKDDAGPEIENKYKTIFQGLNTSLSPDGMNWSSPRKIESDSAGDTHNNAIWVPALGKYVAFTRTWTKSDRAIIGSESKTNHRWMRQVARLESSEFVNWSPVEVVIEGSSWELQPYAISVFECAGLYLGLIAIHDQVSDRVWTELAWSADTTSWERIDQGKPLIGCSETKLDYDYGCVYACVSPVFLDNEIRIYYGGSDWLHFGWRKGCLALATLRADGFAGYQQLRPGEPGMISTSLIPYQGEALKITADVELGGSIEIKVIDPKKSVLAERKLNETATDKIMLEDGQIKSTEIRLEFTIRSAKIFSFVLKRTQKKDFVSSTASRDGSLE